MPKWITAIFVFFLSTTLLTAKAITVEDIISKHIEATSVINSHQDNANRSALLRHYAAKGYYATLEGVEKINNRNCYRIRLHNNTGFIAWFLIDAKSWYIIRTVEQPAVDQRGMNIDVPDTKIKQPQSTPEDKK